MNISFEENAEVTNALRRFSRRIRASSPKKKITIGIIVFLFFYVLFVRAPFGFPLGEAIGIPKGTTLKEASLLLHERKAISSPFLFKGLVILLRGEGGLISGDYYLREPEGVFSLARRFTQGLYGLAPIKVLLPEGATIEEMAAILSETYPRFNANHFKLLAKDKEGYLFPDTYLFFPNVEASQVYNELRDTFTIKIKEIQDEVDAFGKPLEDVVIMASLLEEEARTQETRRMIAGILWDRLRIGMALQVDAVFPYIIGKNTFEVTLEDLEFDSPYNTYKYPGLPPAPITNPGLDSLRAAVNPTPSPYLFYLSDIDGNLHYARTFEEHKQNKARYLR
ncbi:MAG: endolytic transglycosylase MltG [Candidatus Paceibacterota bacterium]